MVMKDYYIILGLPREADKIRIKKAYRDLAKKLHPDTSTAGNSKEFLEAKEAYETLSDDAAKKKYDLELANYQDRVKINRSSRRRQPAHGARSSPCRSRKAAAVSHREYRLDLTLTPTQAHSGCEFSVRLPFIRPCPACRDNNAIDRLFCPHCDGRGFHYSLKEYAVTLPANLSQGQVFRQLAYDNGFFALHLKVRVVILPIAE